MAKGRAWTERRNGRVGILDAFRYCAYKLLIQAVCDQCASLSNSIDSLIIQCVVTTALWEASGRCWLQSCSIRASNLALPLSATRDLPKYLAVHSKAVLQVCSFIYQFSSFLLFEVRHSFLYTAFDMLTHGGKILQSLTEHLPCRRTCAANKSKCESLCTSEVQVSLHAGSASRNRRTGKPGETLRL